jgi:hypothetical protein
VQPVGEQPQRDSNQVECARTMAQGLAVLVVGGQIALALVAVVSNISCRNKWASLATWALGHFW